MTLRTAHYEAMRTLGLTDEEIEEDFKSVCEDLGIHHEELDKAYKPFGSSTREEVPW